MYALLLPNSIPDSIKYAISRRDGVILDCYKSLRRTDGEEIFNQDYLRFSSGDIFWLLVENGSHSAIRSRRYSSSSVAELKYSIYCGIYGDRWTYEAVRFIDGATGLQHVISKQLKDDILVDFELKTNTTPSRFHFESLVDRENSAIQEEQLRLAEKERIALEERNRQRLRDKETNKYKSNYTLNTKKLFSLVKSMGHDPYDLPESLLRELNHYLKKGSSNEDLVDLVSDYMDYKDPYDPYGFNGFHNSYENSVRTQDQLARAEQQVNTPPQVNTPVSSPAPEVRHAGSRREVNAPVQPQTNAEQTNTVPAWIDMNNDSDYETEEDRIRNEEWVNEQELINGSYRRNINDRY